MISDAKQFFSELDTLGAQKVRELLAQGVWVNKQKVDLVHEWLRRREEERINDATSRAESAASRAEDAAFEQLRLDRSTKNAAWIAAIAAIFANIIAIIAIIIAMKHTP